MRKEYQNIVRFDENYYLLPQKFQDELLLEIAEKRGDFTYYTNVVPQSTVNGVIIDLYSILVGEKIEVQFETRYNKNEGTLIIETV